MSLRKLYRLDERAQNLAQEPWRPTPGGNGWSKKNGRMSATITISPRGDGSFVVSSKMNTGTKVRSQQLPARDEAEALMRAEAMKLDIDSRSL
jgi:hypothetical protein